MAESDNSSSATGGQKIKPRTVCEEIPSHWTEVLLYYRFILLSLAGCLLMSILVEFSMITTMICFSLVSFSTFVTMVEFSDRVRSISPDGSAVLVTGCDTGFGNWLVRHLDSLGMIVFAGCLRADDTPATQLRRETSDRVHVLQMDVTQQDQIDACRDDVVRVLEDMGGVGLWGVVNNAGMSFYGDLDLSTMDQILKVINVDQLGAVRVTKTFLPLLKKTKGRVVIVTSVQARVVLPFCGAYSMAKYALEAFADTLRMEMAKFQITVSIVEPCNFGGATSGLDIERKTRECEQMWTAMSEEQREAYGREYLETQFTSIQDLSHSAMFNVYPVIKAMTDSLLVKRPQARYLVGGGQSWYDPVKLWVYYYMILPEWFMDQFLIKCSGDLQPALAKSV